jgi:hypothetical protein
MRRRGDPLKNGIEPKNPLSTIEDPNDEQLKNDLQLSKAIELLQSAIEKQ